MWDIFYFNIKKHETCIGKHFQKSQTLYQIENLEKYWNVKLQKNLKLESLKSQTNTYFHAFKNLKRTTAKTST